MQQAYQTSLIVVLVMLLASKATAQFHSNEACKAVIEVTERLNRADRSIIFRCRPGDNCGGIGDRLGGVMGGAFYALETERTFRVLWPGWEHVFKPGKSNWTFDGPTLGIPYEDAQGQEIDKSRVTDVRGEQIYQAYPDRKDIVVVNDLNSRQVENATLRPTIESYKHIFFHSNRGPTADMFQRIYDKYNWKDLFPRTDESYAAVYRCVFESMFRPTEEFLSSQYKAISRAAVPFSHMVRILEDPKLTSMAFHHRIDDGFENSENEVVDAKTIAKIVELAQKHAVADKKMNLFFVTNSNPSAQKVMQDATIKAAFHAVYCQELTATIHVNTGTGTQEHATAAAVQSTLQAMRDWWIMRLVHVLALYTSGFSKSAALLAPPDQIRYEDGGNAFREHYWTMCGNRFC